jgi:GPN-loop GTPase
MASTAKPQAERPTVVVCIGMAGSGKTTFMHRLNSHLYNRAEPQFVVNLDPAVMNVPYGVNIDIRDSVDYKEVMSQYKLGPNGAIVTSLNLFATKVDQVLGALEKRAKADPENPARKPVKHILIDTPGQIEVFAWSASGQIFLEALASSFPTVVAYIVDTARCARTQTFMSNMLSACSILYKMKLPMILVFNKTDVQDPSFAKEWMTDFDKFQAALNQEEMQAEESGQGAYSHSMVHSMGLMLNEFYEHLSVVPVSARTGAGIDEFFAAVRQKKAEFESDYEPEMQRLRQEKERLKVQRREKELDKMMKGMSVVEREEEVPSPMDSGEEMEGDEEEGGESLQSRYASALEGEGGSLEGEASYAKYLRSQQG